jgi:putative oxidoreductase
MDIGTDMASLILRGAIGSTMVAHGVRHGLTLDGTARWFGSIGFQKPEMQAAMSAVVEVGSGLALVAGAVTPLAGAAVVGTMVVAYRSVHRPNGFFVMDEGWEYVGVISAAAVALSAVGSGRVSVDRLIGLDAVGSGLSRAAVCAALGVVGAVIQLRMFWTAPEAAATAIAAPTESPQLASDTGIGTVHKGEMS